MTTESSTKPSGSATLKRWLIRVGPLLLLVMLVIWFLQRNHESTDDAFIEANVVVISPHISGYVQSVAVQDNQSVQEGQLLVMIDPRDVNLRVAQAEASLAAAQASYGAAQQDLSVVKATTAAAVVQAQQALASALAQHQRAQADAAGAQAQAELARLDAARYRTLFDKEEISRQRLDQALTAQRAAEAQWEAAQRQVTAASAQVGEARAKLTQARSAPLQVAFKKAQEVSHQASEKEAAVTLAQAHLDLAYTRITAPVAGKVTRKNVLPGQWTQPGATLLALVSGPPWIVANYKETQLARMHRGQPVTMRVDAFPGETWHGHVDSFQAGTGARFSLLPAENATGNYVKVVQRIPVKIVFDETPEKLQRLAPGMSVTPVVDVANVASSP